MYTLAGNILTDCDLNRSYEIKQLPFKACFCKYGEGVVFSGGVRGSSACAGIYYWSKGNLQEIGSMIDSRVHHSQVSLGNELYLIGGSNYSNVQINKCEVFNLDTLESREIEPLTVSRSHHTSCVANKGIYVFFGELSSRSQSVEVYNIEKQSWSTLRIKIPGVKGALSIPLNSRYILLVGGWIDRKKNFNSWVLDTCKNTKFSISKTFIPEIYQSYSVTDKIVKVCDSIGYKRLLYKEGVIWECIKTTGNSNWQRRNSAILCYKAGKGPLKRLPLSLFRELVLLL